MEVKEAILLARDALVENSLAEIEAIQLEEANLISGEGLETDQWAITLSFFYVTPELNTDASSFVEQLSGKRSGRIRFSKRVLIQDSDARIVGIMHADG